ncbi:hypothetical protein D9757_002056 [Collybiopsis confluens]|uniref:Uncharacterized protein n=1 Tax=Collybiopsis confluens TaxID=2823264 RepID=A0A8H5HXV4_9AGAR|nr:hypothetical protein D9757_002056 [Collybiopsis confluens]
MDSRRSTQAPFDDLSSTQEFTFTPSPAPKPEISWDMPASSNPTLRDLMDNAERDSRRSDPSPSQNWGFSDPVVTSNSTASTPTSRPPRSIEKAPKSTKQFEVNKALAELTEFDMMSVAKIANQMAAERSRELRGAAYALKKSKAPVKGGKEKLKGSTAVKDGKIQKNIRKGKKEKEVSKPLLLKMSSEAFSRQVLSDVPLANISIATTDSSSNDTSVTDVPMHSYELSAHGYKNSQPVPPSMGVNTTLLALDSPPRAASNVNFPTQLLSKGESYVHGGQRPDTHSMHFPVNPPSTLPRFSKKPPVLGMRRAVTLPTTNSTNSKSAKHADSGSKVEENATNQQRFRTPFLQPTQRPAATQNQSGRAACLVVNEGEEPPATLHE